MCLYRNRVDVHTSVLLSGARGVGKRSTALAAARILHLHFVDVCTCAHYYFLQCSIGF